MQYLELKLIVLVGNAAHCELNPGSRPKVRG